MTGKFIELTFWLLALVTVGWISTTILKRLLGVGGSVKADFDEQVKRAAAIEEEVKRYKEESDRVTIDFKERLRLHRAKYGGGSNEPMPPTDKPTG